MAVRCVPWMRGDLIVVRQGWGIERGPGPMRAELITRSVSMMFCHGGPVLRLRFAVPTSVAGGAMDPELWCTEPPLSKQFFGLMPFTVFLFTGRGCTPAFRKDDL